MPRATTVRVPASSANLGPGFDTLGLALSVYLTCRFRPAERLKITVEGRDTEAIPADESNVIWQTAQRVAANHGRRMPPIELTMTNDIPVGKGLGSSAAALVAGVAIARAVLELDCDPHCILDEAARLEGHPDNVAAAVLGCIVTATIGADGVTRAIRHEMPMDFCVGVVCPDFILPTEKMRAVLPDCYSRDDAVFNLQRATLLVAALWTGDRSAFPEALRDRMHQPYRMKEAPGLERILELRAPGLMGCAMSGAGPAVLVFFEQGAEAVLERVREEFARAGHDSEIIRAGVEREGLRIS